MSDSAETSTPEQRRPMGCVSRVFIGLVLLIASYCIYMPASQAFWDSRVRALCAAEGGVKVFVPEKIRIEPRYVDWAGIWIPRERKIPGKPLPWEQKEDDIYFLRSYSETIHDGNPGAWKSTTEIVRASDNFVLGRGVMFGRYGGDLIAIDSHSQFLCPSGGVTENVVNAVFFQ